MENNTACKKCSRDHYDDFKVPHFLYCFGSNGCFQVEWQQIIGMFGLSSKVDRCLLFFSRRIIGVGNSGRAHLLLSHVWRHSKRRRNYRRSTKKIKKVTLESTGHSRLWTASFCVECKKISGMLFLLEKQYWKKTKIKKRPILISALNYRFTDKERSQPWRILKNFLWDLFK